MSDLMVTANCKAKMSSEMSVVESVAMYVWSVKVSGLVYLQNDDLHVRFRCVHNGV